MVTMYVSPAVAYSDKRSYAVRRVNMRTNDNGITWQAQKQFSLRVDDVSLEDVMNEMSSITSKVTDAKVYNKIKNGYSYSSCYVLGWADADEHETAAAVRSFAAGYASRTL